MQYNIKITVTKGLVDVEKRTKVKTIDKFLVNKDFPSVATVKEIKDFGKTIQIKNYTDEQINGAVLMLGDQVAIDENETVKQHAHINYVINLK
jgi:hypothetical protein